MAATDWILPGGIIVGIFAYATNLQGFKDWVDSRIPTAIGQTPTPQPGGGTTTGTGGTTKTNTSPAAVPCAKQCADKYPGRTPRVTNNICYCDVSGTPGQKCQQLDPTCTTGDRCLCRCSHICAKVPNTAPLVSSDGGCKCINKSTGASQGTPLTPGQKCQQLDPSCTSGDRCLCRCNHLCARTPGYHAQVKSDGTCSCIKDLYTYQQKCQQLDPRCTSGDRCLCRCRNLCGTAASPLVSSDGSCRCIKHASLAYANESLDEGLMQVPTIS